MGVVGVVCCKTLVAPLSEFVWGQEEPENMGAWQFVEPRFRRQLGIQVRKSQPSLSLASQTCSL